MTIYLWGIMENYTVRITSLKSSGLTIRYVIAIFKRTTMLDKAIDNMRRQFICIQIMNTHFLKRARLWKLMFLIMVCTYGFMLKMDY